MSSSYARYLTRDQLQKKTTGGGLSAGPLGAAGACPTITPFSSVASSLCRRLEGSPRPDQEGPGPWVRGGWARVRYREWPLALPGPYPRVISEGSSQRDDTRHSGRARTC